MKLHLPTALQACLMAVLTLSTAHAASINLGSGTGEVSKGSDWTVGNGEYIGILDSAGNLQDNNFSEGVYTNSLNLRSGSLWYKYYDLTINGTGRVVVAGRHGTNNYASITANKITVNASEEAKAPSLIASAITVQDFVLESGNVQLHTDLNSGSLFNGGNDYIGYPTGTAIGNLGEVDSPKQATISNSLLVNGGNLTIGVTNGQGEGHYLSGFGGSITQNGGTITVYDRALASGDISITQTNGSMALSVEGDTRNGRENRRFTFDGNGTATITQSGDSSVMSIGKLSSKGSNNGVNIIQEGKGSINLTNGADYQSSGKSSSITQSGGGSINLTGEFTNTAYQITQKEAGGDLLLKEGAKLTASTITQSSTNGTITISKGATLQAGTVTANGTIKNEGSMSAASLEVTAGLFGNYGELSVGSGEQTRATGSADVVISGGDFQNYGTLNGSISVAGGTLTLEEGSLVGDITMSSGSILIQGASQADSLTLNGGSITFAEGAILTLSDGTVTLNGSSITVLVSEETLNALNDGGSVTLFDTNTSTEAFTNATVTFITSDSASLTATTIGSASGGSISIAVPEPVSATLSLLALTALAARRRRK